MNFITGIKNLLVASIIGISLGTQAKVIIWDMGYTLVETNKMAGAQALGLMDCINYGLFSKDAQHQLKNKTFEVLEHAGKQEGLEHELVRDYEGHPMPLVSCQWLAGEKTSEELLDLTSDLIHNLNKQQFFSNKNEKKLIRNTIRLMFTPEILVSTFKPIKKSTKLLKACATSCDNQGNPNIIMIGSNWDPVSFELLYRNQSFAPIFNYVKPENIVLSGIININKPKPAFFEYILTKYNLNPAECIFIDDQAENVKAASAAGMTGLHICHTKHGYKKLRKELILLGALPCCMDH